jgi:hypothetical protein
MKQKALQNKNPADQIHGFSLQIKKNLPGTAVFFIQIEKKVLETSFREERADFNACKLLSYRFMLIS